MLLGVCWVLNVISRQRDTYLQSSNSNGFSMLLIAIDIDERNRVLSYRIYIRERKKYLAVRVSNDNVRSRLNLARYELEI